MDEDKILGPLTLRQLIYVLLGFGLCNFLYDNLDNSFKIPVIIIIAGIIIAIILNAPKVVFNDDYIKKKKLNSKTPEEFERWVKMKQALIQSQIEFKKSRGAQPDAKLEEMLNLLQNTFIEK